MLSIYIYACCVYNMELLTLSHIPDECGTDRNTINKYSSSKQNSMQEFSCLYSNINEHEIFTLALLEI